MLIGHILEEEGDVGGSSDSKLRSDASSVFSQRGAEEAHRTLHRVSLLGPFASCRRTTRGAGFKKGNRDTVADDTFDTSGFIHGGDPLESLHCPKGLHSAKQDLATWFK